MSAAEKALLAVKAAGRRAGVEVLRFNPTNSLDAARPIVVRDQAIDLVLDVGANQGQWARELRAEGYIGTLVSFEPFAEAFDRLDEAAAGDAAWDARRMALGDRTRRSRPPRRGERGRELLAARDERTRICAPRPTRR